MNPESRDRWVSNLLNEVFLALVADEQLRSVVLFKGARILNRYLGESRQSLDLDSNLASEWMESMPDPEARMTFLKERVPLALGRYFESHVPVRFSVGKIGISQKPPDGRHPRGWNAISLRIEIQDHGMRGVLGLPRLDIDIAAPETLGLKAIQTIDVCGFPARVYSLHRIAGEKLRAFLTSLPAYRRKLSSPTREVRVKDLHDIARILRVHPITDTLFWMDACDEFRLACESRLVDCCGLSSFLEEWPSTRHRYEMDRSLTAVPFDEAESGLRSILAAYECLAIFPMYFPL